MAEKKLVTPVKLAELEVLVSEYKIDLWIRRRGEHQEVHVVRWAFGEYQWRKLIQRLKATGFKFSDGEWLYGASERGKWLV